MLPIIDFIQKNTSIKTMAHLHKVVRWRYAAVQHALRDVPPFDFDLGLGACGDWCSGGSIEDAWTNGRKLVDEIEVPRTVRQFRKLFSSSKTSEPALIETPEQQPVGAAE